MLSRTKRSSGRTASTSIAWLHASGSTDDLSIVGFDGIEAARWTSPPLTTVEQPIEEIAETATNALKSLIVEPAKPLPDFSFRPRLAARGSTAPASAT